MQAPPADASTEGLVEHFFRHESGRLTAALVRRFGAQRIEDIEDAVQFAFERALGTWPRQGLPDVPAAWLMQVAKNRLVDGLRRGNQESLEDSIEAPDLREAPQDQGEELLSLLFACADERLTPRARLVLCLKLVCGFATEEIAVRLFMSPANIQKTLERGRKRLRDSYHRMPSVSVSTTRPGTQLDTVQHVLYLIFNEGYSLGPEDTGLRVELCSEAIRLTGLLVQHPVGDTSSTWALLALMHFHSMRLPARLDSRGQFVPFRDQDRSQWDVHHRQLAFACMEEVVRDDKFSRFHGEAAIQVEHAVALSMEDTRWQEVVALYAALERMMPSPMYTLNRAIAQAEATEPRDGLDLMMQNAWPKWFTEHHLYHATLGDLHRRLNNRAEAARHFARTLETVPSMAERQYFEAQLRAMSDDFR